MLQLNFSGDQNLGMYAKATDHILLVGNSVSDRIVQKITDKLKVPATKLTIANSDLVGIFCCFNSNGLVVPKISTDAELEKLKNISKGLGMNFLVLKSRFTAVGNIALCNDNGALLSKDFSHTDQKLIGECLGVETVSSTMADMHIVGSSGIATNKGCLLHRDATEKEVKTAEDILKVNVDIGTANFGSPFVGCCIIANSNDFVAGENTSGPEITRIQEALGFL